VTERPIDGLRIPASIVSPDAADFIEMTRVRNDIEAEGAGNYDLAYEPTELLPSWQNTDYEPRRLFVARLDGRIVGRGHYETTASDESTTAWLTVVVLPTVRRRGIGAAMYERIESLAAEEGRTVLQAYIMDTADFPGERIPSPTGFGSVSRGSPGSRFALARSFALGQVERVNRLALPTAPGELERHLGAA
jgi:GNAT superfamily N-acetyltransferase